MDGPTSRVIQNEDGKEKWQWKKKRRGVKYYDDLV